MDWAWGRNQPTGLAVSPDGRTVAFSNFLDDEIELYAQIEVCDARPGNPALPRRPELPGRGPDRATTCGQDLPPQAAFSAASYHLLEDPDVVDRFRSDPQGFLDDLRLPAILDEAPRRMGQWFLTGSREAVLMMNVTESMAGRAAVLQLLPLSARESSRVSILSGGYPEALARPGASSLWFSSYVQAYLERDVRSASAVHDLQAFRRFLALIASRHGGILNKSDIAGPLGMSVPSVGRWLDVLEATAQILVVPPARDQVSRRIGSIAICGATVRRVHCLRDRESADERGGTT